MSKPTLREIVNSTVIYDADEVEWTLEELNDDAADILIQPLITHLRALKKEIPKPKFGDTTSIQNSAYNAGIDQLIEDLTEG